MADAEAGEVDSQHPRERQRGSGQGASGQEGVGDETARLEADADDDPAGIDATQEAQGLLGAGDLRKDEVADDRDEKQDGEDTTD